ncbi:hypothetical protein Hypma_003492 [Hypsizygus marmoreus]|uniref:Uncharacterized protein n=1 Tax=Hypsizygus marmoreus TaxID=39966 RepID=A0A369J4H9_HYPMA|nr:hypothetical protein Hypma_003492 [Hypsizygus marmoreus]
MTRTTNAQCPACPISPASSLSRTGYGSYFNDGYPPPGGLPAGYAHPGSYQPGYAHPAYGGGPPRGAYGRYLPDAAHPAHREHLEDDEDVEMGETRNAGWSKQKRREGSR